MIVLANVRARRAPRSQRVARASRRAAPCAIDAALSGAPQQWRGDTKSDQYWGGSLATKDGAYECYMTVKEVAAARTARERREVDSEAERRERVRASQAALRETERKEREEEEEEERRRERALRRDYDDDGGGSGDDDAYDDDEYDDEYDEPPPAAGNLRSRRGWGAGPTAARGGSRATSRRALGRLQGGGGARLVRRPTRVISRGEGCAQVRQNHRTPAAQQPALARLRSGFAHVELVHGTHAVSGSRRNRFIAVSRRDRSPRLASGREGTRYFPLTRPSDRAWRRLGQGRPLAARGLWALGLHVAGCRAHTLARRA
eukprot:7386153-Prymnesium_polylepis.1